MPAEMLIRNCASLALNRPKSPSLVCHLYGALDVAWRLAGYKYALPIGNVRGFTLVPRLRECPGAYAVAPHVDFLEVEFRANWIESLYGDKCFSATELDVHLSAVEARVRFPQLPAAKLIEARRTFEAKKLERAGNKVLVS